MFGRGFGGSGEAEGAGAAGRGGGCGALDAEGPRKKRWLSDAGLPETSDGSHFKKSMKVRDKGSSLGWGISGPVCLVKGGSPFSPSKQRSVPTAQYFRSARWVLPVLKVFALKSFK
jgi:hypothetical protein